MADRPKDERPQASGTEKEAHDAAVAAKEAADRTEAARERTEQAAQQSKDAAASAQQGAVRVSAAVSEMRQLRGQLAGLSAQMDSLPSREELEERLADYQRALEYNRRRGIRQLTGLLVIPIILAVGLIILAGGNRRNGNTLVQCTTPGKSHSVSDPFFTGHKCFDDSSRRTASVLTTAANNEVVIVQCAHDIGTVPDFDPKFQACVVARIQKQTGGDHNR